MTKRKLETVGEHIYWAYANLAMAQSAVTKNQTKYAVVNYMVRAKLFKGLCTGTMNIRSMFDDEKEKLKTGQICNYCGSSEQLSLDHIFPKKLGGKDTGENLVYACKSCNSSKGSKDLMVWMQQQGMFPPLNMIRRYLKLVYYHCLEHNLLDKQITELKHTKLPFSIETLPMEYPDLHKLINSHRL